MKMYRISDLLNLRNVTGHAAFGAWGNFKLKVFFKYADVCLRQKFISIEWRVFTKNPNVIPQLMNNGWNFIR